MTKALVKENGNEDDNKKKADEIVPDPDYEFRRLAMELQQEWARHGEEEMEENAEGRESTRHRIRELIEHNLTHNAEIEACDLLMEVELLDMLVELAKNPKHAHMDYQRICLYLMRFFDFLKK